MTSESFTNYRILIADDESSNVRLLERLLGKAGYLNVQSTTDARAVHSMYEDFHPDLILLDLNMPHLDGFQVMEQLRTLVPERGYFPILVLTADVTPQAKQRALSSGAKDFLTKPFDQNEVLLRIHNLLETRSLHLLLHRQNAQLEERVLERTLELNESHLEILTRLGQAGEFRDDDTGQHTQRVGKASARLARELGLPEDRVELILHAAPLHDVGKIGISDSILLKPGKLTAEEFGIMKTHTAIGVALLANGRSELVRVAELIAGTHHEHWSGSGYPNGLKGEEIPIEGRIVAIADVFDALTHGRPYKKAWTVAEARAELQKQSGCQFDPVAVEAFLRMDFGETL